MFNSKKDKWLAFNVIAQKVIKEKVFHCVDVLEKRIENTRQEITAKLQKIEDIDILRKMAIKAQFDHQTEDLKKQETRIYKFRDVSKGYY